METSTFLIDCFHLISENTPFCQVPKLKIHRVCVDIDNREKSKVPTMCRDEFRLRNFKLWHPILQDFTHSRWLSLPLFLGYRLIVTGYNLAWLIYNIWLYRAKLFIFLTNWTFTILNLYFLLATGLTTSAFYCQYRRSRRETSPSSPGKEGTNTEIEMESGNDKLNDGNTASDEAREEDVLRFQHKFLWLLYIISANGGLLVTAGYWTVLFEEDEPVDANNITKHALNSVFMLIDTFLSSIPVRLFHFIYPLLYIIIYLGFTVVYWVLGGTNIQGERYIYKLLDYDNYDPSTGCLVGFFLLVVQPVLQILLFGFVKLRDYIYKKQNDFV